MSLGPRYSRSPRRIAAEAILGPITDSLQRELLDMALRLEQYEGRATAPQNGCEVHRMSLGDADVLVEFEIEPASGDGWNEPRYERSVSVIGVLVNGVWCDAGEFVPQKVADGWVERYEEMLEEEAHA